MCLFSEGQSLNAAVMLQHHLWSRGHGRPEGGGCPQSEVATMYLGPKLRATEHHRLQLTKAGLPLRASVTERSL